MVMAAMPNPSLPWEKLVESTLLALLQASAEGIIVFDGAGVCRMVGRKAGEYFGCDPVKLVGKPRSEVVVALSRACEEPESFLAMVGETDLGEPAQILGEIEVRSPRRIVLWASFPIKRDDEPAGRLILVRDVTREVSAERARRHLQQRVEQLTPIDALTGLANRRRFIEEHEREHARAGRAWDSYAVLRADVDAMGAVNDTFGVAVGDNALEHVAELLKNDRRDYDVVARLANDEFAILLPGADAVAARAVADRIVAAFAHDAIDRPDGPRLSVSIGVAVCVPPTGETASDVLRRAGEALDTARERGASQIEIDPGSPRAAASP
jgi:diguanylate cyclase (GGDEF)-like protein/PAS domain S-box-containing protein